MGLIAKETKTEGDSAGATRAYQATTNWPRNRVAAVLKGMQPHPRPTTAAGKRRSSMADQQATFSQ